MSFKVVDETKTLAKVKKVFKDEYLPVSELAKKHGLGKIWLKNKINLGRHDSKNEIDYFRYNKQFYWNDRQFLIWYKKNYNDGEGGGAL